MYPKSQALFEESKKIAPGGVHSPVRAFKGMTIPPLFFDKAQGAYLESVDGDRYIDFCQSFGPNLLGHRDPEVSQAVHQVMDNVWTLGACEPYSLRLAEWIREHIPWAEKMRFVSSGTEAVMSACRVARAATGRSLILKFDGCYHGHADGMLVKAGSGLAGAAASDSAGVSSAVASETLICPLDDDEALANVFAEQGSKIAAVIVEPLPANFGLLPQRKEWLDSIFALAKAHGALVIFDEVISGFRVAPGGMAEKLGVKPDLVTYGKVMGGGFPVGCYAGAARYMDLVAPAGPVYQAGTLSANPIGMVAGLATLDKALRENVYDGLAQRTAEFCQALTHGFEKYSVPLQVVQEASLFWLRPKEEKVYRQVTDIPAEHASGFSHLFLNCLSKGIYLAPSAYEVGFVSWAHTDDVLNLAAEKIVEAAKEVYA